MQFGIAMLQPMGFGETSLGHFANAFGHAGEAAQKVTTEEQQERKSQTEAELREARARAAEQSASAAELRALQSGENQRLRTENQQTGSLARALQAQSASRARYDKAKADWDLFHPKEPFQSYGDWIKQDVGEAAGAAGALVPGGAPAAAVPSQSITAGAGRATAEQIMAHPGGQSMIQQIKSMAMSGDPAQMARAKQAVDQHLVPLVSPAERTKLYSLLGIY
jgi:hypothetical protein